MINVVYDRKNFTVTVKGHAASGEAGRDIICSAVSILVYTLEANVKAMKHNGQAKRATSKLESGNAVIKCKPCRSLESVVRVSFNSVCAGFELLSKAYPDFVNYELV